VDVSLAMTIFIVEMVKECDLPGFFVFLGFCPFFACLCTLSFFFHGRLFIETSVLQLFEKTFYLNFAF
jgi:hypothetical protein